MRRFCTTLQIHSLTAMMLNFWTCQLETRESSTGAQMAADEPAPARVRSHPVPPTAAGECSRARSGVRQPPKDEKINTSSGWHRQGAGAQPFLTSLFATSPLSCVASIAWQCVSPSDTLRR
jgi:hypothetical protein